MSTISPREEALFSDALARPARFHALFAISCGQLRLVALGRGMEHPGKGLMLTDVRAMFRARAEAALRLRAGRNFFGPMQPR
jgi:hypothetical protein